jgi:mannose-6-phosphate isomerase
VSAVDQIGASALGMRVPADAVVGLEGVVVSAEWGSTLLLADLRGERPSGRREAEVWFGAHELHPSRLLLHAGAVPFVDTDAPRPAFLVKLLAAAAPLSLQVHPDRATAAAGFAEEEARGVPRAAPERRYRDASDKPELLRALTPMRVLCGFRPAAASRALLAGLAPDGLSDVLSLLARGDAGLPDVVRALLTADASLTRARLAAIADGAAQAVTRTDAADPAVVLLAEVALTLIRATPDDAGVLVALLLDIIDLAPGEAIFVDPGVPHAYLSGLGVEVMASSDNVLRGGMTVKHVDVDEFLRVLDARPRASMRVGALGRGRTARGDWRRFVVPTSAFVVDEIEMDGSTLLERTGSGPSIVVCARGQVDVGSFVGGSVQLRAGQACYVAPGLATVRIEGNGLLVHVRGGIGG